MVDALDLQIARKKVQDYHDQVVQDHRAAMACFDCQEYLAMGMLAYTWIVRAEETAHAAVYENLIDDGHEMIRSIEELYRRWMEAYDVAVKWIDEVCSTGHRPENLDEFLNAHLQVADRLERGEWVSQIAKTRQSLFEQEPW